MLLMQQNRLLLDCEKKNDAVEEQGECEPVFIFTRSRVAYDSFFTPLHANIDVVHPGSTTTRRMSRSRNETASQSGPAFDWLDLHMDTPTRVRDVATRFHGPWAHH
jgi:hypothetical protein